MDFKTPILSRTHEQVSGDKLYNVTTETAVGTDDFIYRRFTWVRADTKNKKLTKPAVTAWRKDEPLVRQTVTFRGGKRFVTATTRSTVEDFMTEHNEWVAA